MVVVIEGKEFDEKPEMLMWKGGGNDFIFGFNGKGVELAMKEGGKR